MVHQRPRFAVDRDGADLFVWMRDAGIHLLVACTDGLSFYFFGKNDGPWLRVKDLVAWYEKEARCGGKAGARYQLAADAYQQVLRKFERGELQER